MFSDKELLIKEIDKIKKKKVLQQITEIILNNNPELNVTENTNGVFMCFDNLTNNTYIELQSCIDNYKNSLKTIPTKTTSEYKYISSDKSDIYDSKYVNKLSNKEKKILRKRLYSEALNINTKTNNYEEIQKEKNRLMTSDTSTTQTESNVYSDVYQDGPSETSEFNNNIFIKKK
jgi:hypothetical protein